MAFLESLGVNVTAVVAELQRAHNEVMDNLPIPSMDAVADAWAQPGVSGAVMDFVRAVDWTEPFFLYLGGFHLAAYVAVWRCGRSSSGAMVCLLAIMCLVLAASSLNELGSAHHASIFRTKTPDEVGGNLLATGPTNYFDKGGVFISAVFSAPLVVLAFLAQIRLFAEAASMMVTIKKGQLQAQQRADAAQSKKSSKKNK